MLQIKNLSVHVGEKPILSQISFDFDLGKNYCILGKNGSGKSSLVMTIAGNPKYEITAWEILLDEQKVHEMTPDQRSKVWIFLAFQNVPEIPGVKFFEFLKTMYDLRQEKPTSFLEFKRIIEPLVEELWFSREFLWRDLNVGFSGGEKRKVEVLQIKLLKPKYIILDEIDSGLDVNAVKQVAELLKSVDTQENSFLVITHLFEMFQELPLEKTLILEQGSIKSVGGRELLEQVRKEGF